MNNCCGVQGLKFAVSHYPWDIRFQFLIQDAISSVSRQDKESKFIHVHVNCGCANFHMKAF